ncbi:MAG: AI-2E family transporter [Burkholderiales bacterium]
MLKSDFRARILFQMMPLSAANRRALIWIAIAIMAFALLHLLAPILMPFILAAVLAYIWRPLVRWLTRKWMPRTLAVVVVLLLECLLLLLLALALLPLFIKEIRLLSEQLPGILDKLNANLAPWLSERLGTTISFDPVSIKAAVTEAIANSEGLGVKILNSLRLGGLGLLGLITNLVLTPVVQFFLMRDWEQMHARVDSLIPRGWHERVSSFVHEADDALGQYLHGQILVIIVMACFYSVGLWIARLEFFLPIGIITGAMVFIPYVGAAIGFLLATLAAALQFQDLPGVLWVWLVFGLGQALEGNFVTPKLVGERIGLHPVAVIFALLAFGQIFGFAGLLVALPTSAVLLVALRKLRSGYLASDLYKGS